MIRKVFYSTRNRNRFMAGFVVLIATAMLFLSDNSLLAQSGPAPFISTQNAVYNAKKRTLTIKGENFQPGAIVSLTNARGQIEHGKIKVKKDTKLVVKKVEEADLAGGVTVTVTNPDGPASAATQLSVTIADDSRLTEADVRTIIAQAVAQAEANNLRATIAVVDGEGNALAIFTMNGAPPTVDVGASFADGAQAKTCINRPLGGCGLEGVRGIIPSCLAALSKAVTGSFLSSQGHAFSTRTASFIVQENFPPGVDFQPSGPLFGVQFSQLLCSDVNPRAPLGLSADPGGIPIYKNGLKVGGIGIEGDGRYTLDPDPRDNDQPVEEIVALGAVRGFEAPPQITGDKIVVNGIRFPYVNVAMPPAVPTQPFNQLRGSLGGLCTDLGLSPAQERGVQPSRFRVVDLDGSGPVPPGRVDDRFFPFRNGSRLTASEVRQILTQGAFQAFITRAAIRQPLNSITEVNLTVCDVDGSILGIFSTIDAPIFGFDVSAQKARTAAFLSNPQAGRLIRQAGFGNYADAGAADGINLDGSIAFSDRAGGFLSRPFFPDGINGTAHGPFSKPIEEFSPFNDGMQLDLILDEYFGSVVRALLGIDPTANLTNALTPPCPSLVLGGPCDEEIGSDGKVFLRCRGVANGTQIFPGSVPLYKDGQLAGGIGISGDGVDQDDIIATTGATGFLPPPEIRSDRFFVRGIRLPFTKFPRHPNR
ncbi:MAG TPA: heme-binding protein [Blastocatellia bacterium]|nr:heme-binding protein [Blastocatellia bacterium]